MSPAAEPTIAAGPEGVRLFLCGDVMTGRAVDQLLPHPAPPQLHEPWVRSAVRYIELAEQRCGQLGRGQDFAYPWGDALALLALFRPALRIVNLETAVTASEDWDRGKGIHYRMNPANLPCLLAAGIDCCVLANNHVLDWGHAGLAETLRVLQGAGLRTAGAGRTAEAAAEPAVLPLPGGGRVLVFAYATESSGVPTAWAATPTRAGVNMLDDVSPAGAERVAATVRRHRQPGDLVVVSLHWGGNWGYRVPPAHRAFARALVEAGGCELLHGHSSHHAMGVEVIRNKLVLYGCGDFLNDYEGIEGHEQYRPELSLMYFPELDRASGDLRRLVLVPLRMRGLRLERADPGGADWLLQTLRREGRPLGTSVDMDGSGAFSLAWR